MKTEIKKLPHSEIEITGEIPSEMFEKNRNKAVLELSKDFELPGFRKGKVPEDMFLQKVPEMIILEEMAEMAINEAYPKIIAEHKIDPIGRPEISITKIAKNNPLCFAIKTALVPEVKLPDYAKVAGGVAEEGAIIVTDKELGDSISEIRKMRAPKLASVPGETPAETPMPEITDDFVKTLGNFQNVSEFKEKLTENIKLEKERAAKEKRRMKILDALVEKTEIDLPKIIIEEEKNKLVHQLRYDVERLGMKFDEYLKNVGKTEDDMKNEWAGEAEKRAKIQFIITEIGIKENINPTEEELSEEVKHLLEHNKDVDENRAKLYLSSLLTNQKVIEFLENQK
ncbi:MAG: trigger factor [Candidatus Paceibacterota bacterium]|jgi:FKBP-type peptidyl-prolyl cis-trans isomerase (trigger factor)